VQLYGEVIARKASTDEGHQKSGNQDFRCQEFGAFIFAKPRTPIRDKAWVARQQSHWLGLSLKG
jgi:hypothetical protein